MLVFYWVSPLYSVWDLNPQNDGTHSRWVTPPQINLFGNAFIDTQRPVSLVIQNLIKLKLRLIISQLAVTIVTIKDKSTFKEETLLAHSFHP